MSATVKYAMPGKRAKAPAREKVPRVARLLALAHKSQGMLDRGEVKSMAELARLGRVSRARVTQIMDLLMLAPEIQEEVLLGARTIGLRELLLVAHEAAWAAQHAAWTSCNDGGWPQGCVRGQNGSMRRPSACKDERMGVAGAEENG